jgi:hypothetical protein
MSLIKLIDLRLANSALEREQDPSLVGTPHRLPYLSKINLVDSLEDTARYAYIVSQLKIADLAFR